jgi:hypothetical protein
MSTIKFLDARIPFVDANGVLTRHAILFLGGIFERIGGSVGPSTVDISASQFEDAGSSEVWAALNQLVQDSGVAPPVIPSVELGLDAAPPQVTLPTEFMLSLVADYQQLYNEIAELRKAVEDLQKGTIL